MHAAISKCLGISPVWPSSVMQNQQRSHLAGLSWNQQHCYCLACILKHDLQLLHDLSMPQSMGMPCRETSPPGWRLQDVPPSPLPACARCHLFSSQHSCLLASSSAGGMLAGGDLAGSDQQTCLKESCVLPAAMQLCQHGSRLTSRSASSSLAASLLQVPSLPSEPSAQAALPSLEAAGLAEEPALLAPLLEEVALAALGLALLFLAGGGASPAASCS